MVPCGPRIELRRIVRRDLPAVAAVERAGFRPGVAMTEDEIRDWLCRPEHVGYLAELGGRVVGIALVDFGDALPSTPIEILSFAVSPEARRLGVGRRMAAALALSRRPAVDAVVRESNLPAQLFFRACGYRAVEILRRPYSTSDEDGYRMRLPLRPAGTAVAGRAAP